MFLYASISFGKWENFNYYFFIVSLKCPLFSLSSLWPPMLILIYLMYPKRPLGSQFLFCIFVLSDSVIYLALYSIWMILLCAHFYPLNCSKGFPSSSIYLLAHISFFTFQFPCPYWKLHFPHQSFSFSTCSGSPGASFASSFKKFSLILLLLNLSRMLPFQWYFFFFFWHVFLIMSLLNSGIWI